MDSAESGRGSDGDGERERGRERDGEREGGREGGRERERERERGGCRVAGTFRKVRRSASPPDRPPARLAVPSEVAVNKSGKDKGGPSEGGFLNNILFSRIVYLFTYTYHQIREMMIMITMMMMMMTTTTTATEYWRL